MNTAENRSVISSKSYSNSSVSPQNVLSLILVIFFLLNCLFICRHKILQKKKDPAVAAISVQNKSSRKSALLQYENSSWYNTNKC